MTITKARDPKSDQDWQDLTSQWQIRPDSIYLNHGSFSPALNCVRYARRSWIDRLDEQPMDFFLRQLEPAIKQSKETLANFIGTDKENVIFVDNATYGMNIVAKSFQLKAGDEVLINDHEYGAVFKIWNRRCESAGATLKIAKLPEKFKTPEQIVESLSSEISDRTKLLIVSHVTSATALVMPVQEICQAFSSRDIAVCIDGPHAPAQLDFQIDDLNCDFYTASCHKWLCGSLGSGFLYVNPRQQERIKPAIVSWGRLKVDQLNSWDEEFTWLGTRDQSPFLCLPAAIEFMDQIGFDNFRARSRHLAAYAEQELRELFGTEPIGDRSKGFYGSMAHVPLPPGDWSNLQKQVWEQIGIEFMVINFDNRWFVRVSCHLYNNQKQIDTLVRALTRLTQ